MPYQNRKIKSIWIKFSQKGFFLLGVEYDKKEMIETLFRGLFQWMC